MDPFGSAALNASEGYNLGAKNVSSQELLGCIGKHQPNKNISMYERNVFSGDVTIDPTSPGVKCFNPQTLSRGMEVNWEPKRFREARNTLRKNRLSQPPLFGQPPSFKNHISR